MGREAVGMRWAGWPALAAAGAATYPLAPAFLYGIATSSLPAPTLVLATFETSHTLAVAVLGRSLLDRGPDFTFASAGPGGLLSSVDGVELAPYYALAVGALAVHLARPLRLTLQRIGGDRLARLAAPTLLTTAILAIAFIGSALLAPSAR